MDFESPEDLKETFLHSDQMHELPESMSIQGIEYRKSTTNDVTFEELISGQKMGMVIYSVLPAEKSKLQKGAEHGGLHEWVVLAWKKRGDSILPLGITSTTPARQGMIPKTIEDEEYSEEDCEISEAQAATPAQETAAQKKDKEWQSRVVGKTAQIAFPQFGRAKSVQGKVDTGANISSLHAEDINVKDDTVTFKAPALSDNVLRMRVETNQAVRSADGGTEYRPVIVLNVNINGKGVNGVEFNLNDRSKMNHDVLIGHNVLEKAGLIIDPTLESEEIDWDALEALFEDIGPSTGPNPFRGKVTVAEAYDILVNNEISFDELFEKARTAGVEAAESVEA